MRVELVTGFEADEVVWSGDRDALILSDRFPINAKALISLLDTNRQRAEVHDIDGNDWTVRVCDQLWIGITFQDWTHGAIDAGKQYRVFSSATKFDRWMLDNVLCNRDIVIVSRRDDLTTKEIPWFVSGDID